MSYWENQRVWVTGGTGFLGKVVVRKLRDRGCRQILATGIGHGDLGDPAVVRQHLDFKPDQVIHLAAVVGGIGANRERPAEFFYQNLMMGTQLMHASWQAGVSEFVAIGTICAYPKFTPVPFKEDHL